MSRALRGLLLGSIAIAFVYLLVHTREPLRLNVGDPGSDANVLTAIHHAAADGLVARAVRGDPGAGPAPALLYGALGKLGVSNIATLRLVALLISALAMGLWFGYVRRIYNERIAWIATALFSTSLLWMMHADSIHQAPLLQCAGFLALWGLVRAIETRRPGHYAAAIAGSFACFFISSDYCLFLPAAVLFTIHGKVGNPFQRGARPLVALCALGCVLGVAARFLCVLGPTGWRELVALSSDVGSWVALPTVIRRITLVLTPFVWITVAFHVVKALRAPSLGAALKDTSAWLLVVGLASLYLFAARGGSQMLASHVLLPFYAIGSARLLDRLLGSVLSVRRLAIAWLVAAPLWSFYFLFTHPRAVLRPDDVAKTNAYLAANDHNDFVLSNLLFDGPLEAAFGRQRWPALDAKDPIGVPRDLMRVFERTGASYVHEIIFTGNATRFVDAALWPLAMPRSLWAIAGAPHLYRAKTNRVIAEYDSRIVKNLKAVQATKVLQLGNYAVYRVDRAAVIELLTKELPVARHIDFGSVNAWPHELLGWSGPALLPDGTSAAVVEGLERCPAAPCKTVLTRSGLRGQGEALTQLGQVLIRVEPVCDLQLTFTFAGPSAARFSVGRFSTGPIAGTPMTFTVPARYLIVSALPDVAPAFATCTSSTA